MKYILSIQTAEYPNSLAFLSEDLKQRKSIVLNERKNSIERLKSSADKLLASNKVTIKNLDFVTVCIGPGSYTGTRGGLAFAKGICQFSNVIMIGVSAFEALEYQLQGVKDYHIMLDAKNQRVFYKHSKSALIRDDYITDVIGDIGEKSLLLGSGAVANADFITKKMAKSATCRNDDLDELNAVKVAEAGIAKYKEKPSIYTNEYLLKAEPLYILPPNITKPKKSY